MSRAIRVLALLEKEGLELLRDPLSLGLTLLTTPFFALAYRSFFPAGSAAFRGFVPGLLVFSIIMLVFSSSMSLAREAEAGTWWWLVSARASLLELLGVKGVVQLALGLSSALLTLLIARALGFESPGSLVLAFGFLALGAAASIALGATVAALAGGRVQRAFLLSSVVMFALLLFSGVVFPRPDFAPWSLFGERFGPFDLLPTTHLSRGLGRVLLEGASFRPLRPTLFWLTASALAHGMFAVWAQRRAQSAPN